MQPQRQDITTAAPCTCHGWLEGYEKWPDCVCEVIGTLAGCIYWTLPEGRRHVFMEIVPSLCGTATRDVDEMIQRVMVIAEAGVQLSGWREWESEVVPEMVQELSDWRHLQRRRPYLITEWAERAAHNITRDPGMAWLALDTLSDLMVRAAK